jgi:N-acetylmuramoyl-L-alanine amidase
MNGGARSYKPQGRATSVRLEQGPTGVRLTIGMSSRLDWRILRSDGGAKQQIQLLPYGASKRAGRAILVDAGHGGSDTGAIGAVGGVYEKELNSEISSRLVAELQRLGYTVLQTRPDDRFVSLGTRGDYANLLLPWLFVSVHCNSYYPDHQGVITFVHPDAGEESRSAAALVHEEFLAATGAESKGVREEDYFVLRETVIPSILIECGFMTHTEECGKLCDPAYQQKIAEGIAKGIDRFVLGY